MGTNASASFASTGLSSGSSQAEDPNGIRRTASECNAGRKVLLGGSEGVLSFSVASSGCSGRPEPSLRLFVVVAVCCCSPLLFGFSLAFTSPAQRSMVGRAIGTDEEVVAPLGLPVFMPSQFPKYATHLNIGAMLGAFAGASISDCVGRRKALALTASLHALSWSLTTILSGVMSLVILRTITGIAVGMGSFLAPCYISEVATPDLRVRLGAANQLAVTMGVIMVTVVGSFVCVVEYDGHHFCDWRRLSKVGVALSVALLFVLCLPESPKWLASQGQFDAARVALKQLRTGDISMEEDELAAIAELVSGIDQASDISAVYQLRDYKRPVLITIGLLVFQQLSGVNAIMMYLTQLCSQVDVAHAEVFATIAVVSQLLFTLSSGLLTDSAGRRPLLQFGGLSMVVAHLGYSYYHLAQEFLLWGPVWLAPVSLGIYIGGFSLGLGPVPWIILAETFPSEVVGKASAVATTVGWLCSAIICWYFFDLEDSLAPDGLYLVLASICFCCFLFVTALVPETRGKTAEEVIALMSGPSRELRRKAPSP